MGLRSAFVLLALVAACRLDEETVTGVRLTVAYAERPTLLRVAGAGTSGRVYGPTRLPQPPRPLDEREESLFVRVPAKLGGSWIEIDVRGLDADGCTMAQGEVRVTVRSGRVVPAHVMLRSTGLDERDDDCLAMEVDRDAAASDASLDAAAEPTQPDAGATDAAQRADAAAGFVDAAQPPVIDTGAPSLEHEDDDMSDESGNPPRARDAGDDDTDAGPRDEDDEHDAPRDAGCPQEVCGRCPVGGTCEIDCRKEDCSAVECRAGASCLMSCAGPKDPCGFASCASDMKKRCGGHRVVCGRDCP